MYKTIKLPEIIPVFPLSNFIFFPKTTVPLNIFEKRYLEMVDDAMKSDRIIGMVQPKESKKNSPLLYKVGCVGKINSFNETDDNRYIIILNGIARFKIIEEVENKKLYRECKVAFDNFSKDLNKIPEKIKFSDLELIFKNLKNLFQKKGYIINWKELEKQDLNQTINTLAMASPFSLEEKQILLESIDLNTRKQKLEEILNTYLVDTQNNKTIQ